MRTRRETRMIYIMVGMPVILIAFLLLGGGPWLEGLGHGTGSMTLNNLHLGQILIGMGLGFLLGWIASRRKW